MDRRRPSDGGSPSAAVWRASSGSGRARPPSSISTSTFSSRRADSVLLRGVPLIPPGVPLIPPDNDVLAGLELGGVPVATALSIRTGRAAPLRPQGSQVLRHDEAGRRPGVRGRRVLIVEDVIITTGGEVLLYATARVWAEPVQGACFLRKAPFAGGNVEVPATDVGRPAPRLSAGALRTP